MAKRFFGTELWEEDWFLDMPNSYKLFWFYILAKCDHAGLFRVNIKKFSLLMDNSINSKQALCYFNEGKNRVREVSESVWLIEDFYFFQYGSSLNMNSKVHESVYNLYNQANINLTSIRGLKDLKERVKDKDKEKERKGGSGEKQKGVEFIENGTIVLFPDKSSQRLGETQLFMLSQGQLRPRDVIQGNSY